MHNIFNINSSLVTGNVYIKESLVNTIRVANTAERNKRWIPDICFIY